MSEHQLVPHIRFQGFEDEWEEEELGKIGHTFSGISGKNKADFGHGKARYVTYMNVFTNSIATKDGLDLIELDRKQHSVKYGDVFFTTSSETPDEVGMSSVWQYNLDNVYLNSFSFGYTPSIKFDLNYLAFVLRSQGVRSRIKILAQGISRYNISKVKMMNIKICFPHTVEQQKIGNLFAKLDQLLDLQQQKLDQLDLLKKAFLQKLFPAQDTEIPELRFQGFENEWEKKRLKEISKIVGGGTPDTKNCEYWGGYINWYSPTEIGNKPYVYSSNKKITKLGLKKSSAKIHPSDTTILFTSRAGIGDMAILKKPAATNQGFQSIELVNGTYPYFIYSYGFEIKRQANTLASGSTFLEISKKDMEKITLNLPTLDEQQKIGAFLAQLDHLIELEQQKLAKMKQVKKALLQNMFVE